MRERPLNDRFKTAPPLVGGGWGEGGENLFAAMTLSPQGAANFRVFRRLSLICASILIILIASTNLYAAPD